MNYEKFDSFITYRTTQQYKNEATADKGLGGFAPYHNSTKESHDGPSSLVQRFPPSPRLVVQGSVLSLHCWLS